MRLRPCGPGNWARYCPRTLHHFLWRRFSRGLARDGGSPGTVPWPFPRSRERGQCTPARPGAWTRAPERGAPLPSCLDFWPTCQAPQVHLSGAAVSPGHPPRNLIADILPTKELQRQLWWRRESNSWCTFFLVHCKLDFKTNHNSNRMNRYQKLWKYISKEDIFFSSV